MLPPDPRGEESKLFEGEDQPQVDTSEARRVSYTQEYPVPSPLSPRCPKVLAVHGCPTPRC